MNTTPTDHKIEFMAWDKWHKPNEDDTSSFVEETHRVMIKLNGDVYNSEYGDDQNDRYHIMQLTALRSINDEPIYNHMIVKNELGSYYLVDMFDYTIMYILSNEKLEIVGNRFQSPELLELCK